MSEGYAACLFGYRIRDLLNAVPDVADHGTRASIDVTFSLRIIEVDALTVRYQRKAGPQVSSYE
jgi:hypothetical protein